MRTLLILGLCATAMVANAQTAKTEIVNKYSIDGEPVYDSPQGIAVLPFTLLSLLQSIA